MARIPITTNPATAGWAADVPTRTALEANFVELYSGVSNTFGMSNLGNSSGTSGVVSGSGVRVLFAGGDNITLSQSVNGQSATITISGAGAGTVSAGEHTLGMSNLGNTSGTSGVVSGSAVQYFFAGGNNVTLSQSINGVSGTVTISAFNQSVQAEGTQTFGMSNLGNTSGTTGVATGTGIAFYLAGGDNITLSQSVNGASGTITISGGAGGAAGTQTGGISNLGNTSGTSGVATGTAIRLVLAGGNNITLSQSLNGASATVTISGADAGGAPTIRFWRNVDGQSQGNFGSYIEKTALADTLGVFPLTPFGGVFPGNMTVSTAYFNWSISGSAATNSVAYTSSIFMGVYTFNAGTLSLLNSVSTSWGSNANNASLSTMGHGRRWMSIHSSLWSSSPVFTQGDYWVATLLRTSGARNQTGGIYAGLFATRGNMSGTIGDATVANSSMGVQPLYGFYTASTAGLPASIASADLNKIAVAGAEQIPFLIFNNLTNSF